MFIQWLGVGAGVSGKLRSRASDVSTKWSAAITCGIRTLAVGVGRLGGRTRLRVAHIQGPAVGRGARLALLALLALAALRALPALVVAVRADDVGGLGSEDR